MTNDNLEQLDVFYGDLTANRAYVYARLPRQADGAGLTLSGHVRGPRCLHAQTLPSVAPLVDLGPGPTLLARAAVMEPCFWSPDLPAIYDVTVQFQRGTEILATARREIGLRSLGIRGRYISLEGKRWVLRGVLPTSTTAKLPRDWHDASASLVVSSLDFQLMDNQLSEASQFGAFAIVELPRGSAAVRELKQISRYPSAAMAIQQRDMPREFSKVDAAPNILLAQRLDAGDPLVRQPWAEMFLTTTPEPELLTEIARLGELPIIVVRELATPVAISEARGGCDQLQRDLAPVGQFAGYVV